MMAKRGELAVKIVPYDRTAPQLFQRLREFLANVVPYELQIEHVGSTAVEGLGGKGIIDVLIATEKKYMDTALEILEANGFRPDPEPISEERLFASGPFKCDTRELHVHIHITFPGSREHKDKLLFRDYLRAHPEEAETYYHLKKQWSVEAGPDRPRYSELKGSYIDRILKKARRGL
jgi:GrpB-like predicted nucleotidyltransferase (UPF0157 family)